MSHHRPVPLTIRIKRHYNLLALFYYGLWGYHVHHGYWDDEADMASPRAAQERLIWELYRFGGAPVPLRMLDVGCGAGGSLLWLAKHVQATGSGITLSRMQQLIGQAAFLAAGLARRLTIRVADAQHGWPVDDASVNLVWCVECSEHLQDRAHFARESHRALAPGGALCVAAWLAGPDIGPDAEVLRQRVEHGMLCHPFGTEAEYCRWFADAGFIGIKSRIVTPHVLRTWDLCIQLRDRPGLPWLARHLGADVRAFTEVFHDLRQAYLEGAMAYGFFTARKRLCLP
jgi:tocopherol O-methyltransferase